MKYIDDDTKKLYKWNRNYFFAGTLSIILFVVIFYGLIGSIILELVHIIFNLSTDTSTGNNWEHVLDFKNLIITFFNNFRHANLQHLSLNMLCFLICGGWLERRKGTLGIVLLVLVMSSISSAYVAANHQSVNSIGFSGVNYCLYAYAIIDYCFLLSKKETRTKINVISGAILMALMYLSFCFNGGVETFSFAWYPYDFMTNMGHYSSFVGGAILGLTVQFVKLVARKEAKNE